MPQMLHQALISKLSLPKPGCRPIVLNAGQRATRVYLGSRRHLMKNDFNPKAGEQAKIKGYGYGDDVIASSVTLVSESKTLRLRDDDGYPLWQRGWCQRRRGRNKSGAPGSKP